MSSGKEGMAHIVGFRCVRCGGTLSYSPLTYVCPSCGPEGTLDVIYDYAGIRNKWPRDSLAHERDLTLWRYAPILPVADGGPRPPLPLPVTPLYRTTSLGKGIGVKNLWIKDETRQPTGSLKDRASAVAVAKALELGAEAITCASTGNAAISLAGMVASVGLECFIFVPASAPEAKLAQLSAYGARVVAIKGSYDQAYDLCLLASERWGWYSRNTGYNPHLSEGKKSAALEICEQMDWEPPDIVFVGVGDGCIIGGLWSGFHDLMELGFIGTMPRLVGVQAEGCQPLVRAWQSGGRPLEPHPRTIADSISVGVPRDALKALRAVRESGGRMVAVSDQEMLSAIRMLGQQAGILGEPSGVAGFAGMLKMKSMGEIDPAWRVVVLVTGAGLKDLESLKKVAAPMVQIEPDINKVAAALGL